MAENLSLFPFHRHALAIIAKAVRLRAFFDRKTNPDFSSHKTILE